ncbi:MBOAT family protein [Clostridiaceae bacterium OM02-2AC]|nr:MBOAT family protein [Clostridiaceae bacterium OM02-2AC]
MNYISIEFFFFVMLSLLIYYIIPIKNRWIILLVFSFSFYLSFDKIYILFLLTTILTTFFCGVLLEKSKHKKLVLILCIVINAFIWFLTKNYNWYALTFNRLLNVLNIDLFSMPVINNIIVPIGISYFVLQSIGYLIDVYHGYKAEHNVFKYSLFLTWFPAIVQGPISRYEQLSKQLFNNKKFDYDNFSHNMLLIIFGVIKKMVIADNIAVIVNYCYQNVDSLEGFILYLGAIAYSIQLYMDFAGCVDICRGVSGLFRIKLIQNFKSPYFSKSIKEFWSRWHISLSTWLKDYIYIPLGGNRKGKYRKYLNILIVFIVSGIWHGAGICFIIWGLLHALFQIIGDITLSMRISLKKVLHITDNYSSNIYSTIITFNLVTFAWIFFRAPSLEIALLYFKNMFELTNLYILFDGSLFSYGLNQNTLLIVLLNILLVFYVDYKHYRNTFGMRNNIQSLHILLRWSIYFLLIYDILLFGAYGVGISSTAFLYGGF